eukprot:PhF_6_TR11749/c0_g2_i1/m.19231
MLRKSIQVQTDHYVPPGADPSGPKVYFRCIGPNSKVHQMKLSSDTAIQVLVAKLPFAGPYTWHDIPIDPRLTPSHYNMLAGEENCVTLIAQGSEKLNPQSFDTTSDKVRALNFKIRQLEEEVEQKNKILKEIYAQHPSIEALREENGKLRFDNSILTNEKISMAARIKDLEENLKFHVHASTVPEPPVDVDREDTINQLRMEISRWQENALNPKVQPHSTITHGTIGDAEYIQSPNPAIKDGHALMNLMSEVITSLKRLPNEIGSMVQTTKPVVSHYRNPTATHMAHHHYQPSRAPSVASIHGAESNTPRTQQQQQQQHTPSSHHHHMYSSPRPSVAVSHYPPKIVRVVYINEATGEEEHEKVEVIPPVNIKRTLEAVRMTNKSVNLGRAVVCVQSEGAEPVVLDTIKEARKVLHPNDILYIAFLK